MDSLANILKSAREQKAITLREVAEAVCIDQSLISKFEKDDRKPTKEQIIKLAEFYGLPEEELIISWHSERILDELKYADSAIEILKVAEQKIEYYKRQADGR